jgi:hypothetical protein
MTNPALFELPESVEPIRWNEMVTTLSNDEGEIIRWIINLHNGGQPFDVDPTYSTGRFWQGLPQPLHRFDLAPQSEVVLQADARNLPLDSESVGSVMFDPPFVVAPSPKPGIIRDPFSCYADVPTLWAFYRAALTEFWRILRSKGIVAFKCQDIVSGSINYMTHAFVIVAAQEIGFYVKDLFILQATSVLYSPNMAHQQHARKTHSYFLVLQKGAPEGKRRRAKVT